MNNEIHRDQFDAWERGYREALLDVFCLLTGDEQILDADKAHLSLLDALVVQVACANVRLVEA